ncbi:hypothetical protein JX265_008554 [Neoarthrinium moseri]|uniref:BTB domain-containing protein n=1 Tax=Neoarthrinium moseri TaxID=1658444 RepID=A0A9Q0AM07_9PEZI|nr:hypothetical protein JX265_008554 [Neoarthrinium moseri]
MARKRYTVTLDMPRRRAASPTPASPSKRLKLSKNYEEKVKIKVKNDGREGYFRVPKEKIMEASASFRRKLADHTGDEELEMEDVSLQTFNVFFDWLDDQKISIKGLDMVEEDDKEVDGQEQDSLTATTRNAIKDAPTWLTDNHRSYPRMQSDYVLAKLLDVYLFSRAYGVAYLASEVILTWQRFQWKVQCLTDQYIIQKGLEQLNIEDPLVRYWISDHAHHSTFEKDDKYSALSPQFLVAMLHVAKKRGDKGGYNRDNPDLEWCRFHGHETEREQKSCEASRPDDYDMQEKSTRQCSNSSCQGLTLEESRKTRDGSWKCEQKGY